MSGFYKSLRITRFNLLPQHRSCPPVQVKLSILNFIVSLLKSNPWLFKILRGKLYIIIVVLRFFKNLVEIYAL